MAVYAVGDLQGAYAPLMRLLERLGFDPAADRLWLVGDLVNRGPDSLGTLRWVHAHRDAVVSVLGNHDLHLLARAGDPARRSGDDDLQPVLEAPDAHELIEWLRRRPLIHYDRALATAMVHAGIPPGWDLETALAEARAVADALAGPAWRELLAQLYGDTPARWSPALDGHERARFTINALTRMRYCRADGSLDLEAKGPPGQGPPGSMPWFDHPAAAGGHARLVIGHWSALGLVHRRDLVALDTGCCWGNALTALRLDAPDAKPVSVRCGHGGT